MPVITEEALLERRRGSGRGLWLLLVPPVLALLLLAAATIRPVELGRHMLVVGFARRPGFGWTVRSTPGPGPLSRGITMRMRDHNYRIYGGGRNSVLGLGDWVCFISWIRGHRE